MESINFKIYPSAVDPARIPGRAPTVIILSPVHAGSQGFALNLSEEGYQVVLIDNGPNTSSLAALRNEPKIENDHYLADGDLRETDGWSAAVNLIHLIDAHLEGGWNRYTALITLRLDPQDADLVRALHWETTRRGGLSAYVTYGTQLTNDQAIQAVQRIDDEDYPLLVHLPEAETFVINVLVEEAKKGNLPQDALPFHPELDQFQATLGPVKPKSVSIFTYPSIEAHGDASVWLALSPSRNIQKTLLIPQTLKVNTRSKRVIEAQRR